MSYDVVRDPLRSASDLRAMLTVERVSHAWDGATSTAHVQVRSDSALGWMSIRWQADARVVQIFTPLSGPVPEAAGDRVRALLLRVNHALAIGSLGLDPTSGVAYARLALPLQPDGSLCPALLRACFARVGALVDDFVPTIAAAIAGAPSTDPT